MVQRLQERIQGLEQTVRDRDLDIGRMEELVREREGERGSCAQREVVYVDRVVERIVEVEVVKELIKEVLVVR